MSNPQSEKYQFTGKQSMFIHSFAHEIHDEWALHSRRYSNQGAAILHTTKSLSSWSLRPLGEADDKRMNKAAVCHVMRRALRTKEIV